MYKREQELDNVDKSLIYGSIGLTGIIIICLLIMLVFFII